MRFSVAVRHAPKTGHNLADYEDAFWPIPDGDRMHVIADRLTVSVADGASQASFSSLWAKSITEHYASLVGANPGPPALVPEEFQAQLTPLAKAWSQRVFSRALPWHAVEKAQHGSFATLLGLTLQVDDEEGGRWHAVAIGDSCLFQVRDDQLITSWPATDPTAFGNHPDLLATDPAYNASLWPRAADLQRQGTWSRTDTWYLLTDAVAQWFLTQAQAHKRPWRTLNRLMGPAAHFANWLARTRAAQAIRDDDVTVMIVNTRPHRPSHD
jgi:hypothetical protein